MADQLPAGFVPDGFVPASGASPQMNFAIVNGQKVNLDESPFLRGAYEFYKKSPVGAAVDLAGGVANAVGLTGNGFHPLDAAWDAGKGLLKAQWDQAVLAAQKAKAAANGDPLSASEAVGHGLAAILPILGPAAADVGEHGAQGDIAGMVGGGLGLLSPFALKYGLELKQRAANTPAQADRLSREAEQTVAQRVLAPANPKYKPTATAIAGDILKRGLSGDRVALQQAAEQGMADAGNAIDAATAAQGGKTAAVPTQPIVDALSKRIDEFKINGETIPTAADRVAHLTQLRDYIQKMGAQAPLGDILKMRDEFYDTAAKAGGYARTGNASMGDLAWAAREAGSAIREHLADLNPDAASARADYSFWKSINDVLDPNLGRPKATNAPSGVTGGRATVGAVAAEAIGNTPLGKAAAAIGLGKILPWIQDVVASPQWQLAKASQKYALAQAIRNGQPALAQGILVKISAGLPRSGGGTSMVASDQDTPTPAVASR